MRIIDIYNDEGIKRYAKKLTDDDPTEAEDLFSHCIEICLKDKKKLKAIEGRGKLKQYFVVMLKYQHFKRAKKKREYLQVEEDMLMSEPFKEEEDRIQKQKVKEKVKDTLAAMHFFTSGLLKLYVDSSYREIAKKTQINYVSVSRGVNAAKKEFMKIYNGTKIAILLPEVSGVEYHRLVVPLVKMAEKYNAELLFFHTSKEEYFRDKWISQIPAGNHSCCFQSKHFKRSATGNRDCTIEATRH